MERALTLRFTALEKPPVGYGYTFGCTVAKAEAGEFGQDSFIMTVLVADKGVLSQLEQSAPGHVFVGEFVFHAADVPYNLMPITGFVDRTKTAWKLTTLK